MSANRSRPRLVPASKVKVPSSLTQSSVPASSSMPKPSWTGCQGKLQSWSSPGTRSLDRDRDRTRLADRLRNAASRTPSVAQLRAKGTRTIVRVPSGPLEASGSLSMPAAGPVSVTSTSSSPATADQLTSDGNSSTWPNVSSTRSSPCASSPGVREVTVMASGSAWMPVWTARAWYMSMLPTSPAAGTTSSAASAGDIQLVRQHSPAGVTPHPPTSTW